MATGYSDYISGTSMGAKLRFSYSTTYDAPHNRVTVSVIPQILTTTVTGGTRGYNGNLYGNGSSIYAMNAGYSADNTLIAASGSGYYINFLPKTGSISTITVNLNSSGRGSFTLGGYFKYRAEYDGTTGDFRSSTGITVYVSESAPYAISYNANGGSGAPSSQSIYAGVSYNLSSTRPTRTGYNFLGWSTSSSASSASYSPGQSVTPNGNLALYAIWQKKSFTLSISQGVGSIVSVLKGSSSLSNGDTIYYGDTLSISITADIGYNIGTHTVNNSDWTSGTLTVTDNVSVVSTATLIQYTLSIITSQQGVTTNVERLTSPIGGGSIGVITNGAILYYNDTLNINYALGGAYQLLTATVNGVDISEETLPYSVTVASNIVLSVTAKLGAIIYIANEAYQIFIGDGTNWNQYQAFIGNGSEFDQY